MHNLRMMPDWQSAVRRVVLPASDRGLALEELRLMNITRASLFPGLDGFAQSFRQLLVKESRQRAIIREAVLSAVGTSTFQAEGTKAEPR